MIVLADHTKWGIRGLARIASLGEASMVITDDRLPARAASILTDVGTEVRQV